MEDPYHAFLDDFGFDLDGGARQPEGPLAGVTVAVKDVFDVAGEVTGNGQPTWRASHAPAKAHAPTVAALLGAGARLIGRTVNDELCYSLNGTNIHYGAPVNPRSPDRLVGGSSCGSAAAVAGGLTDTAIGTDCAGSVRVPAAFCGIYGIRPTYGRVSAEAVFALAPSFDAVGWFARDPVLFAALGRVLIPDHAASAPTPGRLLVADDLFDVLPPSARAVARDLVGKVARGLDLPPTGEIIASEGVDSWAQTFRVIQAREVTLNLGPWVAGHSPDLAPAIAARIDWAATVIDAEADEAKPRRADIAGRQESLLADNAVLCLPTAGVAPRLSDGDEALEEFRWNTLKLTCPAGLAGLPQVHLPLGEIDGCPIGVSLMAARGGDEMLLACAERIA